MKTAPTAKDFTMQMVQRHNNLVLQETKTPVTHTDVLRELIEQEASYNETLLQKTFYETCSAKTDEIKKNSLKEYTFNWDAEKNKEKHHFWHCSSFSEHSINLGMKEKICLICRNKSVP